MRAVALVLVLAAGGVGACGVRSSSTARDGAAGERPRLVVLVVIDQLPAWAFAAKQPHLTGGIARAVREGVWYTGEYPSAATVTAAGHATLGTGASPRDTGILANDWWRRDVGRELAVVDDGAGGITTRELRVPGIADVLVVASPSSRAVGVALKPRAALLPLGQKAGLAFWYDPERLGWTSQGARPRWLDELERRHPIKPRLGYTWTPRDAQRLARLTGLGDDLPGELAMHRLGPTFPHVLGTADAPNKAIAATPLGNEIVLEAALAALDGESLGRDAVPDFLSVSFSAHDYIGHAWGHESWEAWDALERLDQSIAILFDELDRRVGRGHWSVIVTSDHGAAPLPERTGKGGRKTYADIEARAEEAARGVLGAGDWVAAVRYPSIYLAQMSDAQRARAIDAIVASLRALPWLSDVERRDKRVGDCSAMRGNAARWCWALDPATSGDIVFAPAPGFVVHEADEPIATHHGSLYAYDYQVPVLVMGPGFRGGHRVDAPVSMLRVTPTLAAWLGVPPPSAARAAKLRSER